MAENSTGNTNGICSTCPVRVLKLLPGQALTALTITLAVGMVLSVLEIIYLSFIYPSQLNTIIGVATPLVTLLFHSGNILNQRKKIGRDNGGSSGSSDVSS